MGKESEIEKKKKKGLHAVEKRGFPLRKSGIRS